MPNYLTVAEASKVERNPLRRGVMQILSRSAPFFSLVPFQRIDGNAYTYVQSTKLPSVSFRGVNEGYTPSSGVVNPQTESLTIIGGEFDTDKFLVITQPSTSVDRHRAITTEQQAEALGKKIMKSFFKGNHDSNPREFDGLERRIIGRQLIDCGSFAGASPASGGNVPTLRDINLLLSRLRGKADALFMNTDMHLLVEHLIRSSGSAFELVNDEFGRVLTRYRGVFILPIEEDEADAAILPFTENDSLGASASCTSIYAVRFGADQYTTMLENSRGLMVDDLGELESAPKYRTRAEWYLALAVFDGRSVGRLRGCKLG